jgi:ComF family protein
LFPARCRLCSAPLVHISRLPVCRPCLSALRPIAGGVCCVCGERLIGSYSTLGQDGEARCSLCLRLQPPFAKASAYGSYDGGLRDLIQLLKYERVKPAAAVLGRMLAEAIADLAPAFGAESVVVVPVPLHSRRLRERGFNQAELIARAAMKLHPVGNKLQLKTGALERCRETSSQTGLTRHQRRENLRGAFVAARPDEATGRQFLLVDDVFTTGTTVSECARILLRAGASKVFVATVARTLKAEASFTTMQKTTDASMAMAANA